MLGMLAATAVVAAFQLDRGGVAVVGSAAASRLPASGVPTLAAVDLAALLLPAIGVAIVGYSDNVLTARAFAVRRGETIRGTPELVALGATNLAAGVLHGFPVSSSGSRTAIGDAQGSRTQLHSLVALVLMVIVRVAGGGLLARFPRAALGAVVIFAAIRLVDVAGFHRIARFRRSEALIALVTAVAVLTVGVLYGVLVAVGLSELDLLHRLARPTTASWPTCRAWPGCTSRRLPRRAAGSRSSRLPLRRAAVLRQRRGLPPPGARGTGRPAGAASLVPAQRRGQRRDRQHRRAGPGRAARRAAAARDRAGAGAGQARAARRPPRSGAARLHRR